MELRFGDNNILEQPFVIKKKALKVILNLSFGMSCRGVFRQNGFLTVPVPNVP